MHDITHDTLVDAAAAHAEEQRGRIESARTGSAQYQWSAMLLPAGQRLLGRVAEGHHALLAALSRNPYRAVGPVDIADVEPQGVQGGIGQASDAHDPFIAMDRAFGLGQRTGVDLPGEAAGRVPGREAKRATWEATREDLCARAVTGYPEVATTDPERAAYLTQVAVENCQSGFQYRAGDAANLAIGQGELAVTPLQMAVAYAALANGGTLLTPRVGRALVDPATGGEEAVRAGPTRATGADPGVTAYVAEGLRSVVTGGTAAGVFAGMAEDWPVAGKTGTAEVLGRGDTSWFVSWAPSTAPRYAVAVVVSQGGTGAETAAPVARAVHEALRAAGP